MLNAVRSLTSLHGGATVLDVASGPGEPALTIAQSFPTLAVISTDAQPDMVAQAQKRATALSLSNVTCVVADMTDLSAFQSDSIDIVTCCYGVMFPADKRKALSEMHRVLKPGGHVVATYWEQLDLVELGRVVMGGALGLDHAVPLPPDADPLSLREPGAFAALATDAGFTVKEEVKSQYPFVLGDDESEQFAMAMLLFKSKLDALDAAAHDKAHASFAKNIGTFASRSEGEGPLQVPNNVFVMTTLVK